MGKGLLTLYPVFFHFLDLGDGLPQVVRELFAVLGVGGVEVDEDFDVRTRDGRRKPDSVGIIWEINAALLKAFLSARPREIKKIKGQRK